MRHTIKQRQLLSTRPLSMLLPGLVGLSAASLLLGGCGPSSFKYTLRNIEHVERLIDAVPVDPDAKTEEPSDSVKKRVPPPAFMELPRIKARFCLKRAIENYFNSRWSTGMDIGMLVLAGVGGGVGTSMGAAAAAMDDSNGNRKGIGIASVTALAAAGAVLGLRAALNLNEVGRAQKVAAARDVNAAISIFERYALADDPQEVGEDGFGTCRDEDINVANALPGSKSAEPIEAVLARAKSDKAEKASEASTHEKASADARTAADGVQKRIELLKTEKESELSRSAPAVRSTVEKTYDVAKSELETRAKELEDKAKLEAAKARVATAQADVAENKVAVIHASGQLRRAIFFLTARDVQTTYRILDESRAALSQSYVTLKAAKKALDTLLTAASR